MILTRSKLNQLEESMRLPMTQRQKADILEHFGTEPQPYQWTEEDIVIQIRNFMERGVFSRPAPGDFDYSQSYNQHNGLIDGEPF